MTLKTKLILSSVSSIVILLDQLVKLSVLRALQPGESIVVIPGVFNIVLTFNKGIAFGIFSDFPDSIRLLLLIVTGTAALATVVYFLLGEYYDDVIAQIALAMVIGGAVGNIIDRVRLGHVVDFLDFYYAQYHWPAFNLADSAICISVVVLLLRYPQHRRMKVDEL